MPRYHVKDTQESGDSKFQSSTGSKSSTDISSSSNSGSGSHGACDSSSTSGGSSNNSVTGFRPLYLPNSTQACHCSACVGAVAANVHPVRERKGERGRERERERKGEGERERDTERERKE